MLTIIGICMLIVGSVGIFISLLLAFLWKIPDLLDELSGRKAKRQITRMKELNIGTGGIEGITTNELYEMINASGNLVWGSLGTRSQNLEEEEERVKGKEKVVEKVEVTTPVNKVVENVGEVSEKKDERVIQTESDIEDSEIDIEENDDDEVPTGNLIESGEDFSSINSEKVNVVVIEEQMSIKRG